MENGKPLTFPIILTNVSIMNENILRINSVNILYAMKCHYLQNTL